MKFFICKFSRQQIVTPAEANQYIDQAKADMIAVKEKMERERERQESELHKKLSALKQKRLTDLEKQHDLELKEYDKQCQTMQAQGPIGESYRVNLELLYGLVKFRHYSIVKTLDSLKSITVCDIAFMVLSPVSWWFQFSWCTCI